MREILNGFSQQLKQSKIPTDIFQIINEIVTLISNNNCKQAVQYSLQVIPKNSGQYGKVLETLKCIAEALC